MFFRLLLMLFTTLLLAACATTRADPETSTGSKREPTLIALTEAMDAIARGNATVSQALSPLVALPFPEDVQPRDTVSVSGFLDAKGNLIHQLEIRTSRGGIDSSRLVIARLEPEPCVNLENLAAHIGATDFVGIPPSPHTPVEHRSPGVRGYAARYWDSGELRITASMDRPGCATLLRAQQPLSQARLHQTTTAVEYNLMMLTDAMLAIARSEKNVEQALSPLMELPALSGFPEEGSLRITKFPRVLGKILQHLDIQIGTSPDNAVTVIAHLHAEPCRETRWVRRQANDFFLPLGPPEPLGAAGLPDTVGYRARRTGDGEFLIMAHKDKPDCVIALSARQP